MALSGIRKYFDRYAIALASTLGIYSIGVIQTGEFNPARIPRAYIESVRAEYLNSDENQNKSRRDK